MNDEQMLRIDSIKALSVDLLTAAHDNDEGRLFAVMAELTELFRIVRMEHDTAMARSAKRLAEVHLEPDPPATRSGDALKDLVEAEFMRQVGISHHVPGEPEEFCLENPPVVTEPEPSYDMSPVQPWFEYEAEGEQEEEGAEDDEQEDADPELRMSGMYDASAKWV